MNSTITNYYYDGDSLNVLYETNGNNEIIRSYVYSESGQLLAMRKGNDTFFYHYNAHGDVIALTDQQGKVVAKYEYDAWGNPITVEEDSSVADNPFRYAGYQYDKETGMYYLIARYYHPEHGVFLSPDPDPGIKEDILSQNGYAYTNNNPVMLVDPDGHLFWVVVNGGFAAYDGYKAYKSGKGWKGAAVAAASNLVGVGKLKKASKIVKATKPVNLPSYKKIKIDMKHILSRHTKSGNVAVQSGKKSLFPSYMSKKEIERTIKNAYKNGKRIKTQGHKVKVHGKSGKLKIEMWVNTKTKTIESAYPI